MITQLRLLNYRKFKKESINLAPLNVFIGANGSGKSTVGSSVYAIATIIRLGLKAAFPKGLIHSFFNVINYDKNLYGYKYPPIGLGISGRIKAISFDYDIIFSPDSNSQSGFYINYEGLKIQSQGFTGEYAIGKLPNTDFPIPTSPDENLWIPGIPSIPQRDTLFIEVASSGGNEELQACLKNIRQHMQRVKKFQFQPSAARTGYEQYDGSGKQPFLEDDGANLAQIVQFFQEESRGSLADLKSRVVEYAKGGSRIVDIGVTTYGDQVFLNFYEEGQGRKTFEVRGPLLSDGYWVFTAFASLAACEVLPSWAFFEEPESHLHPHKLPLLYDIFETLAYKRSEPCQVMISTHSPYFLDLLKQKPDSVILLKAGESKKLPQIPDYEKVLSLQTLGEAWYSNIFDWGNP